MVTRESLADRFLTGKNRIAVGTLGGGIVGGALLAVLEGIVAVVLSGGQAVDILLGGYAQALGSLINNLFTGLEAEAADAWDPIQAGVFSLPLNALIVIIGFVAAALVVRWLRD